MGSVWLLLSVTALHVSWPRDWLLTTAVGPPPRPRCGLRLPTIPTSARSPPVPVAEGLPQCCAPVV